VQNNLPSLQKNGIGLENTIHRLELLYPNRYVLNIANDKKTFEVNLEIDL
jgi:LytS/YehU family sensor histidine kinase